MKKIICIFLATIFLISVAVSCADNKADEQTTANTSRVPTTPAVSSTPAESSSVPVENTSEAESTVETENTESTSTQAATEAVVTQPPVTEPAEVTQAVTEPVVTTPHATEAPVTTVSVTEAPAVTEPETEAPALVIPESGSEMGENLYNDLFASAEFTSIYELYAYIKNMSKQELDNILANEQKYLWDTVQSIHVSKDELQNGIFGYFKDGIRSSGAIVVPHFNGSPMALQDGAKIVLDTDQSLRKPRIYYPSDRNVSFSMIKYDTELVSEAAEKGTAWLIKELNSEQLNLHNYEKMINDALSQGIMGVKNTVVYEKEYKLADRTVKALVYDKSDLSADELASGAKQTIQIFFAYDDMLVKVTGNKTDVLDIFAGLTFEEVKVDA